MEGVNINRIFDFFKYCILLVDDKMTVNSYFSPFAFPFCAVELYNTVRLKMESITIFICGSSVSNKLKFPFTCAKLGYALPLLSFKFQGKWTPVHIAGVALPCRTIHLPAEQFLF